MMKVKNGIRKIRVFFWTSLARIRVKEMGRECRINHCSHFSRNTTIGNDCHFNGVKVNGNGNVSIGDHFHSGEGLLIITQNHNYDGGTKLPYDDTYCIKDVSIGKNVWLGSRVIILPGSTIEDGVVIQAGSVVHGQMPRCSVCGGNPCKVIKYRDMEHYSRLDG